MSWGVCASLAAASLLWLGASLCWRPDRAPARAIAASTPPAALADLPLVTRTAPATVAVPSVGATTNALTPAHPLTPAHELLRRERSLIARLDAAVDARDAAALRRTLDQYRRELPRDEQRLQAGYALLASCLEGPSVAALGDAQRFYDDHRGSTLRRWVRRICLES